MEEADEHLQRKLPDPQPGKVDVAPKLQLQRRQELEHALRARPDDPALFLELAQLYRDEHRPLEAKRVLQQACSIFPGNTEVLWQFEEALLARSLQQFREANDLASRVNSAEADEQLERSQQDWIKQRIEVCSARLRRDPSLDQLRVVMAEALFDDGSYEQAILDVGPATTSDRFSPQAFLMKGRCELALGRPAEAMKSLRAAAMRREIPAPLKIRVAGLRLLCETATSLGLTGSGKHYQNALRQAEKELSATAGG